MKKIFALTALALAGCITVQYPGPPPVTTPPVVTPPATDSALPKLGDIGMIWGDWDKEWHARGWNEGSFHWKDSVYNNVIRLPSGAVKLQLNSAGEAGLQHSGVPASTSISCQMDIEVGHMESGIVGAPFWFWNGAGGGPEIDMEIAGLNGMQFNAHANGQTLAAPVIPKGWEGDVSGKRGTFGIIYKGGQFESFLLDGKEILRLDASNIPGGKVPTEPLTVYSTIWGFPGGAGWVGPLTANPQADFTLHGFSCQTI